MIILFDEIKKIVSDIKSNYNNNKRCLHFIFVGENFFFIFVEDRVYKMKSILQ